MEMKKKYHLKISSELKKLASDKESIIMLSPMFNDFVGLGGLQLIEKSLPSYKKTVRGYLKLIKELHVK